MQFKRKAKKSTKNIIVLSVLAALIVALAIMAAVFSGRVPEAEPEPDTPLVEIRPEEGRYNTYATAYPPLEESDIMSIRISNEKGTYIMARPDAKGSFEFIYYDENGKEHYYYPEILIEEEDFIYDDLYAAVTGDGYDIIPMLTYLIVAIRTPYFDDRIFLKEDLDARNKQLAAYGLSPETAGGVESADATVKKTLTFFYNEKDGDTVVTKTHKIEIGSSTVSGSGFYFRVDDRDYIYVTRELNYFQYALVGVEEFISPVLVAAGLDNNSHALYAPYLTPAYRQWLNKLHEDDPFPTATKDIKSITRIIAQVNSYMPSYVLENVEDESTIKDSYEWFSLDEYFFDTDEYTDNALYSYFVSALSGKDLNEKITQSFLTERQTKEGKTYEYRIKKIEGIITANGDNDAVGTSVGTSRYVKVVYELFVDGVQMNTVKNSITDEQGNVTDIHEIVVPYHGILDLEMLDKAGIDTAAIRALYVGDEPTDLNVTVKYDKKDADGNSTGLSYTTARYYVDAVLAIYEVTEYDENGKALKWELSLSDKVTDDSIVVYRYYYTMNGEELTAATGMIQMKATDDEADTEQKAKIRSAIKKMLADDEEKTTLAFTEALFDDVMSDYITYEFVNTTAYLTSELIVGFGFVNASERDPFYGESFYEKHDDCTMLYAMNQDSCETVVKLLGGIAETSSAEGLKGMQTVEVGINHARLEKYGCYKNTVLFSLPRDMYVSNETGDDELDDMAWTRTLDFVLYISDPQWDPESEKTVRYVATEMYDVIVKIEADDIGFIDLETVDFWARRNLILVNVADLKEMTLQLNMDDLQGDYTFNLTHQDVYIDSYTGKVYTAATRPEDGVFTTYNWIEVFVTQHGDMTLINGQKTAFRKYLETAGKWSYVSERGTARLSDFYDYLAGAPVSGGTDSKGTATFKELILLLYYTRYTGTLTDEEQAAVLDPNGDGNTDDKADPIMKMSVRLNDKDPNAKTGRIYCYEFYRCDDRRVMVRIYETNENGTVYGNQYASDFYISILAFRKIVSGFVGILNGKTLDVEEPYPEII